MGELWAKFLSWLRGLFGEKKQAPALEEPAGDRPWSASIDALPWGMRKRLNGLPNELPERIEEVVASAVDDYIALSRAMKQRAIVAVQLDQDEFLEETTSTVNRMIADAPRIAEALATSKRNPEHLTAQRDADEAFYGMKEAGKIVKEVSLAASRYVAAVSDEDAEILRLKAAILHELVKEYDERSRRA